MTFTPFGNETEAISLGALNIENREDHISIYGSLAITRDRSGLAAAKALKDICDRIVRELEGEPSLPSQVAAVEPPAKVKNPFGHA